MNIIVFEDGLHNNFYPLSLTKPLWELRSGLYTFKERFDLFTKKEPHLAGSVIYYFTRDYLVPYFREKYPHDRINDYSVFDKGGEALFINAVKYPAESDSSIEKNSAVASMPVPVVARIDELPKLKAGDDIAAMIMRCGLFLKDYEEYERSGGGKMANYIWELVDCNNDIIADDFILSGKKGNGSARKDVTILGDSNQVYIEDNVRIDPHVVIDASEGPVMIMTGTRIYSFTRIEGPCAIGNNCVIMGPKVRGGTSLGPCSRVGGEVEQSIFHGYSNKYHDGFIGHAYIGEWVNMGALTTNSDLKNDYSNVKVYIPDSRKKTGLKKVGCFMGDYVKTSIGTLINTGTSIGTGAMLVHAGQLTPSHIPAFSWYINARVSAMNWIDRFIEINREAMSRRKIELSDALSAMLKAVYEMTNQNIEQ